MKIVSYVDGKFLYVKCIQIQPLPTLPKKKEDLGKPVKREWRQPILTSVQGESITFNQISPEDIDSLITALQEAKVKYEKHLTTLG